MIIRIDDASINTDMYDLRKQIDYWHKFVPSVKFIIGINLIAKSNNEFSVYPNPPFKKRDRPFFYDVDSIIDKSWFDDIAVSRDEIASHGLIHVDHSLLSYDAQEMSIVSSCNILGSKKFIPPFNQYNAYTESVCKKYGIELIGNTDTIRWKSLETHDFDPNYEYWYYHPWRVNAHSLKRRFFQINHETVTR